MCAYCLLVASDLKQGTLRRNGHQSGAVSEDRATACVTAARRTTQARVTRPSMRGAQRVHLVDWVARHAASFRDSEFIAGVWRPLWQFLKCHFDELGYFWVWVCECGDEVEVVKIGYLTRLADYARGSKGRLVHEASKMTNRESPAASCANERGKVA